MILKKIIYKSDFLPLCHFGLMLLGEFGDDQKYFVIAGLYLKV